MPAHVFLCMCEYVCCTKWQIRDNPLNEKSLSTLSSYINWEILCGYWIDILCFILLYNV